MQTYKINFPTRVMFGIDIVKQLGKEASALGTKAFVLYDPYLKGSDTINNMLADLKEHNVDYIEFNDVVPNPRNTTIDRAAGICKDAGCDIVIGIGGGSAIDSSKAVALVNTNGGTCWEYTERSGPGEVVHRPEHMPLPIIAIPTTAGTGTEATNMAVVNNPALTSKCSIINDKIFPTVSLVDPRLQSTVPPLMTALTGLDTFAHAFEAYIGKTLHPWSETITLRAIELFAHSIRDVVKDGSDLEARGKMALACSLAGWSITTSGVCLPHALGQPLSAYTDAPHGGTLAACIPQVIEWTLPYAEEKMAKVATIFEPELASKSVSEQAAELPRIMHELYEDINVHVSFGGYGLKEEDIPGFTDLVFNGFKQDADNHPKPVTREAVEEIVRKCM